MGIKHFLYDFDKNRKSFITNFFDINLLKII